MADPVVQTSFGRVRGALQDGVYVFRGIRYGATTGGENRFQPPKPPEPWAGVHDATEFGASAPQSNPNPAPADALSPIITSQIPRAPKTSTTPRPQESEDCLFLNVWTAGVKDDRKRPVMVWLHGGFFRSGSGSTIDGAALARRGDAVVVSVNHRLNIFGFNHLADLAGSAFQHSGNAGMLDIMAALRWVRDNAEAFGGDSGRVMVFGASGGGMKTAFLMASPAASGLLHRAGVQSGPGLRVMERDVASRAADMVLRELGLTSARADDLRAIESERLLAAFHSVSAQLPPAEYRDLTSFAPVLDAEILPHHPFDPVAAPGTGAIPLLLGWNREDMAFFMGADPAAFALSESELIVRAEKMLGTRAQAGLALYRDLYPDFTPPQTYVRMVTDREMMAPTMRQAHLHAAANAAPTYVYRFDRGSPALGGKLGALHTLEANFVFNTLGADPELTGSGSEAQGLADTMSNAWVSFAASGDPGSAKDGGLSWPRFVPGEANTMVFNGSSRVRRNPVAAEYRFMSEALV